MALWITIVWQILKQLSPLYMRLEACRFSFFYRLSHV